MNRSTPGLDHKKLIMDLGMTMQKRQYKIHPDVENFFSAIVGASNTEQVDQDVMTNMLEMLKNVLDTYQNRQLRNFLYTLNNIFSRQALYHSNYYKLYFELGNINFEYSKPEYQEYVEVPEEIEEEIMELEEEDFISDDEVEEISDSWGDDGGGWGDDDGWGDSDGWGDDSGGGDSFESEPIEEEVIEKVVHEFVPPETIVFTPPN